MNESRQKLVIALAALGVGVVLWGAVRFGWYAPRAAELNERLAEATENVQSHQAALDQRPRLHRELDDIVNRTLGSDVESVDHRLRTRLNRIAEQLQLKQPVVSTGRPSARQNPGRMAFPRAAAELRNEIDFVELDGSISAEGTLDQVVALVDRIDAEPWIKRVHSLRIDPRDNGERFAVTVRLTTLFLPGRTPEELPTSEYDEQRLARFATLVSANPFRLPPPEVEEPRPAPQQQPQQQPTRIVEQWRVTGIAQGPEGFEAWLRNAQSGEARRVSIGERVHDAVLVAADREQAEFQQNDQRLVVAVGGTLSVQR